LFSIGIVYLWFITKNWVLNNLLGTTLAIIFMKTLQMTSLTPGTILLTGLFFYDIFWVFLSPYFTAKGESVMVEVATSLDVPIKLVLPHLLGNAQSGHCTMLGLGDIVIPGMFICFMKAAGEKIPELNGTTVYFWWCLLAYAASLLFCGGILFVFNAA
jgi:presenilin-like A22 family membrane protease